MSPPIPKMSFASMCDKLILAAQRGFVRIVFRPQKVRNINFLWDDPNPDFNPVKAEPPTIDVFFPKTTPQHTIEKLASHIEQTYDAHIVRHNQMLVIYETNRTE